MCVDPRYHAERLDPDLASLVPDEVEVVRVGAISVEYTRPFGIIGDVGLRGYFHLRAALARHLSGRRTDVVLITGSPYYPMLLASWIRHRFGVPIILDFQDPWVSAQGANQPRFTKGWLSYRIACVLEPRVVSNAAFITSVSDRQNDDLASRYRWLDRSRMAAIPIGGDPHDYVALRSSKVDTHCENRFQLCYVGTALPRAGPLFGALFRGLARLRADKPRLAEKIECRFVGTSNQPNDSSHFRVLSLAKAEGVGDLVVEEPARVPYLEALRILANTDAVLLIGSDEPHYTASKIYPALMSGRPFLSVFHRQSSAHDILVRAGGGLALSFSTPTELDGLVPDIATSLERLCKNPGSLESTDPGALAPFTARSLAGRFAEVFERALRVHNSAA